MESLGNFMNSNQPLVEREAGFINHGEDFVSPTCKPESGRVDDIIEGFLFRHPRWITKVYPRTCPCFRIYTIEQGEK